MADEYQMLEELGSGSFGTVYRALHKPSGDFVAIKHIDLEGSDDDIREIQQEISLLATCSSEYVTRYRTSFTRGVKLWIVMEYLGGGSCLDLLKPCPKGLDERYIAIIMRELLFGLDYLHTTGKIHRDIKAANILLSETGQVKIADFGVAAQLTNIKSQRLTFVGTPFWMAPEVIQEAGYDFRADIWSLGITAMELALGEPPRSDVHPMKVLFLIPKEKPPRLEGPRWSKELKDFVCLCLNKEADKRPSAKALLKHPFIKRAGRTEALQEMVNRAKQFDQTGTDRERDVKYYEETMKNMSHAMGDDEWVFDTVRPSMSIAARPLGQHTIKRRKLGRTSSGNSTDVDQAAASLEHLSLDISPLGDGLVPITPAKEATTIRTPKPRHVSSHRRVSAATARKVSISSPAHRRTSRMVSGNTPTARRVSAQQVQQTRPPLGLDMSFGNGKSTVRQFKRVDSGNRPYTPTDDVASLSPQDSVFDSDVENKPPPLNRNQDRFQPVVPATKESLLGRRAYAKCLDAAFQETYAATAERNKREALSKVAEAWSRLDELDPEGELLLLRSIIDRVQADPKLASVLLPHRVASTQLASLREASPTKRLPLAHESEFSRRESTPQSSPTKSRYNNDTHLSPARSPSKHDGTSPGKLVLNPQNPHLRKMRSSQQQLQAEREKSMLEEKSRLEEKMPGAKAEPGMEHTGMLADVLYGRWIEGLKARWPAA